MELLKEIEKVQINLKAKNYRIALEKCNKLLKKFPDNAFLYNLGGLILQQIQNITISVQYFQKAISLDPKNLPAKNNLANSLKVLGKFDLSEKLYKEVLEIKPDYLKALNNYGNLKQQLNDYEGAIELYKKASLIEPSNITILMSLAGAYHSVGKINESKEIIYKILEINPQIMSAHKLLSSIIKYDEGNKHMLQMLELSKENNLSESQKIDLHFAIGKSFEDIENYDLAFQNFKIANKIKKKTIDFDIDKDRKLFKSIKDAFKEIDFNNTVTSLNKKKIIFICGMPRSGTTLVEQIIASHSKVDGAGELIYLQQSIKNNFFENDVVKKQLLIEDIHAERTNLIDFYFNMLNLHNFKNDTITDKAPQNFRWLGFIKIFFPNSKIIHCSRNAKDVSLSLFKNSFASTDMNWTYSTDDIVNYYNLYGDIMNFWREKMGDHIYNICYEELTNNKETEIKKVLEFCDLDFQDACLNHHKNLKTPIKTVSVTQAREPIYTRSINKNKFYENNLNKMFSLLK